MVNPRAGGADEPGPRAVCGRRGVTPLSHYTTPQSTSKEIPGANTASAVIPLAAYPSYRRIHCI